MRKASKRVTTRNRGTQERSRETFAAIVNATIRILEKDPSQLTTNHIADKAGVSVGTLYQYFPNKQSIMSEIIEQELSKDLQLFQSTFSGKSSSSIREAVSVIVDVCIKINDRHANLKKALFEYMVTSQKVKFVREIHFQNVKLVRDYVRSARDWPKSVEPTFFSLMSLSVAASVFQLMTEFDEITEAKIRSELERLMLGYLKI